MKTFLILVLLAVIVWLLWPRSTHVTPRVSDLRGSVYPNQPLSSSNPPKMDTEDMISIFRMYGESYEGTVLYHDTDTKETLEWDEVNRRFQNPPAFFERHYRVSEVIGLFVILCVGGGGGGVTVLTFFYTVGGATTGYSRSYVSGVPTASSSAGSGASGCLGVLLIAGIIFYYCYLSSPHFGKFCGVCIDGVLWFLGYALSGGPLTH